MIILEFLVSASIVGLIIYGVVGGWYGYKEREAEMNGEQPVRDGNEPFYWMTIGSWQNHSNDHTNVNENPNISSNDYDYHENYYDEHVDF